MPGMELKKPLALEELKRARKPIRNVNIEHKEGLSKPERFAVWITDDIGTMGFLFLILVEVGRIELPCRERCVSVSTKRRSSCQKINSDFRCICIR